MSKYKTDRIKSDIERLVKRACGGVEEPHCSTDELEEIHEHLSFLQEDINMHLSERRKEEADE